MMYPKFFPPRLVLSKFEVHIEYFYFYVLGLLSVPEQHFAAVHKLLI
jgi:hypothetical protein